MKKRIALPALLALFGLGTGTAQAEPKNGFGLDAGLTTQHMTSPAGNYQSRGLSLGIDYQIVAASNFSINPFLMSSGENTSGTATGNTKAAHGILGLQFRYWIDDIFVGAHVASYSEVLSVTNGNVTNSTSVNGGGVGLVAGWEDPNSGLFIMGQLDSANLKYPTATNKLSGFRLSLGYRWK
jgi:hypothetical protein